MNNVENKYEQMYEFENDSQLYNFRFKDIGIPMWMYIRAYFIRNVIDKKLWTQTNKIWKAKGNNSFIKKNTVDKYIRKNPFLSNRKEILFAFWTYSELRPHEDGLVYEDFIMPFLQMFPNKTTTLMDGNMLNEYEKNCAHPNWKMNDIFIDILKYKKYIERKHETCIEDQRNIKGLIAFLDYNCPFHIDSALIKEISYSLNYFAQNSKMMIKICELYLQVVRPKIAIICCASYPDIFRTSLILACRNRKVVTAELQHGISSRCHPNYQYSDYIINSSECSKMLPDYFLTFGEYWNSQIKIPQKSSVIGYAKPIIENPVSINSKILFCAGIDFDRYMSFLEELIPKLDVNTEIYFRFHPVYSTQKQRDRFAKFLKYSNFFTADEKDLNFYLEKCCYVIVDGSTVCYEALFMGRIVFSFLSEQSIRMGMNKLLSVYLINDVDEFMNLWNDRDALKAKRHNEFLNVNYKKNYIKFLKRCGVDTNAKHGIRRRTR